MTRRISVEFFLAILIPVITAIPLTLHADSVTLFTTFGPGHTYNCCVDFQEAGVNYGPGGTQTSMWAMAFTPNATSPLFAIDSAIGAANEPQQFTFDLMSSTGDLPGSILESWTLTTTLLAATCDHCFVTAISTLHPVLQAGTQYWIVVFPNDNMDGVWDSSNVAQGTTAYSLNNGQTWTLHTNGDIGAFDVRGVSSSTVPEPGTVLLMGTGLAGIAGAIRRNLRW